jgi:hypothetical protein
MTDKTELMISNAEKMKNAPRNSQFHVMNPIEGQIDKAASDLLASCFRPGTPPKPADAMQLSQALVNLGHARQLLSSKK